MSDDSSPGLNLKEQIARIDRMLLESQKFAAEQRKLTAEAAKMDRDRTLAPWQVVVTAMGTGGALVAATVALMKVLGG